MLLHGFFHHAQHIYFVNRCRGVVGRFFRPADLRTKKIKTCDENKKTNENNAAQFLAVDSRVKGHFVIFVKKAQEESGAVNTSPLFASSI
ncbi:hypothetical protein [Desulfobulbus sp.]|uniref:hypothetical protein n=1 Tax=Desulfobulbus sp. TaxID=895 RepID=UPI0027BACF26|nr:hypothetical protein [Desulfobulbus sp.]